MLCVGWGMWGVEGMWGWWGGNGLWGSLSVCVWV